MCLSINEDKLHEFLSKQTGTDETREMKYRLGSGIGIDLFVHTGRERDCFLLSDGRPSFVMAEIAPREANHGRPAALPLDLHEAFDHLSGLPRRLSAPVETNAPEMVVVCQYSELEKLCSSAGVRHIYRNVTHDGRSISGSYTAGPFY